MCTEAALLEVFTHTHMQAASKNAFVQFLNAHWTMPIDCTKRRGGMQAGGK